MDRFHNKSIIRRQRRRRIEIKRRVNRPLLKTNGDSEGKKKTKLKEIFITILFYLTGKTKNQ